MRKSVGNINFAMDNHLMNKLIGSWPIGQNFSAPSMNSVVEITFVKIFIASSGGDNCKPFQ